MVTTSRLSELVSIQKLAVSGNTFGAPVEVWSHFANVYMSINTQRGNTNFTAPGNVYNDSISFYGRYIPIAKKGFRLIYKGDVYEFTNVTVVQRNQAIILDCTSVE